MAHKKSVTVQGITFPTKKDALHYYNVSCTTVNKRLKKGMSVDEAYTKSTKYVAPKSLCVEGIEFSSLRQACIHFHKDEGTVKARISKGASYEEALTMPDSYFINKKGFKGNKVSFRNIEYQTEKDACNAFGVNPKNVSVYKRRHNMTFEKALEHFIKQGKQING